jgi:hypothetical protein
VGIAVDTTVISMAARKRPRSKATTVRGRLVWRGNPSSILRVDDQFLMPGDLTGRIRNIAENGARGNPSPVRNDRTGSRAWKFVNGTAIRITR